MNILFYTPYKVSAIRGGTERTTITVATGLSKFCDCHCFSVYSHESDTPKEKCFVEELLLNITDEELVTQFIRRNNIDWLVIQGAFHMVNFFKNATLKTKCKIVFAHHYEPGGERIISGLSKYVDNVTHYRSFSHLIKSCAKLLFYPFFRWKENKRLHYNYKNAYAKSDKIVLLSHSFVPGYQSFAGIEENKKFVIIPNGLTYSLFEKKEDIVRKGKNVLIVARLVEEQKRISMALDMWEQVKKRDDVSEWKLNIVGDGKDKDKYIDIVNKRRIQDVVFYGKKDPRPFYVESSIFMMTSQMEGWGLTLTESQQFGVVPIAFDTYSSLKDIITDGVDGFVIPKNNMALYISRMYSLMINNDLRRNLAEVCIENSKRFSQENIAKRWWKLFSES